MIVLSISFTDCIPPLPEGLAAVPVEDLLSVLYEGFSVRGFFGRSVCRGGTGGFGYRCGTETAVQGQHLVERLLIGDEADTDQIPASLVEGGTVHTEALHH
jgi:hypothetical protein